MEDDVVVVPAHTFDSWRQAKRESKAALQADPFPEDLFPSMDSPKVQVVFHLDVDVSAVDWLPAVFKDALLGLLGGGATPDDVEIVAVSPSAAVTCKLSNGAARAVTTDKEATLGLERKLSARYRAAVDARSAAPAAAPRGVPEGVAGPESPPVA